MKKGITERTVRIFKMIVPLVFILAFAAGICLLCLRNIDRGQYEERVATSNMLMEKISQNMESAIDFNWNMLYYLKNEIEDEAYDSMDALLQKMGKCRKYMQDGLGQRVIMIDNKGRCYSSEGFVNKWQANSLLLETNDRVYISEYQIGSDRNMKMFFITRLSEPIEVDGITLTHITMVNDMQMFDEFFNVSSQGEESITFIIHANGSQIYRQNKETALSGIYNVLSVLEDSKFNYDGSMEKVRKDIDNRVTDTVHVTCDEVDYFVSYSHLNINDWVAILMVPEQYVGTGTKAYTYSLVINIVVIFCVIVALTALLLIVLGYKMVKNEERVKEQLRSAAEAERLANEAKTRFLSTMSHDIRTPMNAIVGMTVIASKQLDDTEYMKECFEKIKQASNHLLMLINDILDISKVESGKMTLNCAVFSLADCATNLVNIVQTQVKEKRLEFNIRVHGMEHEFLYGDELRLNQIFINILSNAIKFTGVGGKVEIDLSQEPVSGREDAVTLIYQVADTGIGMSEEFQTTMYDTFTRAMDSRISKIQGSGLGLAICKQIVDMMGGTITCQSQEGKGTTFTIRIELPIGKEEEYQALPPMRLLLVDDDEVFLDTATDTINSLGLFVDCEKSGAGALQRVVKAHERGVDYPIVIIDRKMPDMDGIETTRAIRKMFGEDVPIIMISAYDTAEFEHEALLAGANCVISKPFFKSVLYKQLCNLLHLGETENPQEEIAEQALEGMHVLVAEDNSMNWEIIKVLLEMYGVKAEQAEDGKRCVEMLEQAEKNAYDAVLMDVRMPIMDGREATRQIRASKKEWIQQIPVIAMTADAFAEDIQACMEAGMDEHLSKPIDVNKLVRKLRKVRKGYKGAGKKKEA